MSIWRRVVLAITWLACLVDFVFVIWLVSMTFVRHASIADIAFGGLLSLIMLVGGLFFALMVDRVCAALDTKSRQ